MNSEELTNLELKISNLRSDVYSKMVAITKRIDDECHEIWPVVSVESLTDMLIELKELTAKLPSRSEYKHK